VLNCSNLTIDVELVIEMDDDESHDDNGETSHDDNGETIKTYWLTTLGESCKAL
jgi:hypothetical protein